ncbi:unnamed protein product [Pieris brassicae]|uniref:Uncharacterized protein n=1 Tax=Pieris brassicae TaxID=7116 RepID=A0A9P0TPK6_PIEBR|nr:unnamed protein product [Pieris brassicae]
MLYITKALQGVSSGRGRASPCVVSDARAKGSRPAVTEKVQLRVVIVTYTSLHKLPSQLKSPYKFLHKKL